MSRRSFKERLGRLPAKAARRPTTAARSSGESEDGGGLWSVGEWFALGLLILAAVAIISRDAALIWKLIYLAPFITVFFAYVLLRGVFRRRGGDVTFMGFLFDWWT